MQNETIQKNAYHESGRVVFTYLNGYWCDSMELPGHGSGAGTKLNAGKDLSLVQAVLAGNPLAVSTENKEHAIEVAGKLMTIYCAGSCAYSFLQNNANIPAELDLEIPGQDLKTIDRVQSYLRKAIVDYSPDYPGQIIAAIFKKLKDADVWKAIELLASKVSQEADKSLNRFYIEDTLMQAGIRVVKSPARSAISLGLHDDSEMKPPEKEVKTTSFDVENLTPLDIMLRDFLKNIKKDWRPGELNAATRYLHDVYKKYG